jgi:hypothetical protein
MSRGRWFERVGPREQLTLTATCRQVDGWRVAAAIAGEKLAEWAVEALDEAARAAVATTMNGGQPEESSCDSPPAPGPLRWLPWPRNAPPPADGTGEPGPSAANHPRPSQ